MKARAAPRAPAKKRAPPLRPDAPRAPGRALPRARTTFVGRERDLAAIRRLVEDGAQLVTLLGPPGIGKTRLAIEAARGLGDDVAFCDISEARDAAALFTAAALALGVSVEAPSSSDALAALVGRALAQRGEAVLVLDNAEQVVADAANAVGRWMDEAPGALFLVTSRERLRIAGEHAMTLDPLEVPRRGETSPASLLASEAVALLVDRARAARPGLAVADEDAPVLAEIARRVEGVPLAIELCAARLAMLAPAQLLARLSQRLDVLASDRRGAPERQATLRGAIDGSWELLDAAERSALAQCSVFRGGFDLDAAEAVVAVAPGSPPALDLLSALHDKSLLVASDGDGAVKRYRLYESIRAYAADRLDEAGGTREAEARHARYFAEAGARWAAAAKGKAFREGLAALEREQDNLLAARAHASRAGDLARAVAVTLCLEPLAIVRGPAPPYLALLSETLAEAGDRLPPALAARALGSLGVVESRLGKPRESIASFARAVARAEEAGDLAQLPFLLAKLGNQLCVIDDRPAAEAAFERARALLDRHDDPAVRGIFCRHHAFFLWRAGRVSEARRRGEEARALLEAHGDRRELAYVLCDLAASYLDAAELDSAEGALAAALDLLRQLRYRRVESRCLLLVAMARREQGRLAEAEADLDRALALPVEDGDHGAEGMALWHLACLALERDDAEAARRFGERALARYRESGDGHLVAHARMVLGAALARLGEPDAAAAEIAEADALLSGAAGPVRDALALFAAQVPLARAAAKLDAGDRAAAALHRAEAERALADLDARTEGTPIASVRFARRILVRALGAAAPVRRERRPASVTDAALVVSDDGRWFRLSERREVSLERRAALRRILAALARARVASPGSALTLDEVLAAGWPGERMSAEAGAARVYNAIQRLRRLGLDGVLRTRDDGYLLDVEISTRLAGGPLAAGG
jgi:predicted ATPase